jgi:Fe-S oxidoreductase
LKPRFSKKAPDINTDASSLVIRLTDKEILTGKGLTESESKGQIKVGLVVPCYIDPFCSEVGDATPELLERFGVEVEN